MIRFDRPVPRGGYAWWYVDALSDDGRHALTLIAFIGSVFSPYYAAARRLAPGRAAPEDFVAINLALYGPRGNRWTMTERRRHSLRAEADSLAIGPSRLAVDARGLAAEIAEWSNPLPRRVRGTVRLVPHALEPTTYKLDAAGRHRWQPLAPCARIRVAFTAPELAWEGNAYLDRNDGDEPIAHAFRRWHWSRAATRQGAAILYHAERRDGGQTSLALGFAAGGGATAFTPPPAAALPATRWRLARETHSDGGARLIRNLEDTPFYARARIAASLGGEQVEAVHETLDCDRLVHPAVQFMLPFRMPRRFI